MREKLKRLDTSEASNAKLKIVFIKHSWINLIRKRMTALFRYASTTTLLRSMGLKEVHRDNKENLITPKHHSKMSFLATPMLSSSHSTEKTSSKKRLILMHCWTLQTTFTLKSIKRSSHMKLSRTSRAPVISVAIALIWHRITSLALMVLQITRMKKWRTKI